MSLETLFDSKSSLFLKDKLLRLASLFSLLLSIFSCFSSWSLIAFNCSSFLPATFFNLFKSSSSSSSNPLSKALANKEYSNLVCLTTPTTILNLHKSHFYTYPIL